MLRRQFCGRSWNSDEVIARRTLHLPPEKPVIALDVLLAMWAGEFEFVHKSLLVCVGFFWQATMSAAH